MEAQRQALPTTIRSPPAVAGYTPLAEYQQETPASFVGGRPVLHFHADGAKAYVPASQREQLPFFPADGPQAAEDADDGAEEKMMKRYEKWIGETKKRGVKMSPITACQQAPAFFAIYGYVTRMSK